jgi:hypothetical protein
VKTIGPPLADQVPADWQDKVMHSRLTLGDQVLMGGDVAPDRYEEPSRRSLRDTVVDQLRGEPMTATEFRRIALSLPDVVEGSHMGHADFRVAGKIFATLGCPSDRFGVVMLSPQDQDLIVRDYPKIFAPVAGKWGASGSTTAVLRQAGKRAVAIALEAAWRKRAPKRLPSSRSTRRATPSSRPE